MSSSPVSSVPNLTHSFVGETFASFFVLASTLGDRDVLSFDFFVCSGVQNNKTTRTNKFVVEFYVFYEFNNIKLFTKAQF